MGSQRIGQELSDLAHILILSESENESSSVVSNTL